ESLLEGDVPHVVGDAEEAVRGGHHARPMRAPSRARIPARSRLLAMSRSDSAPATSPAFSAASASARILATICAVRSWMRAACVAVMVLIVLSLVGACIHRLEHTRIHSQPLWSPKMNTPLTPIPTRPDREDWRTRAACIDHDPE